MENIGKKIEWKIMFSTVWHWVENIEDGKLGRKFSLLVRKSHPPKPGGKVMREKCSHKPLTILPYPTILIHDFLFFFGVKNTHDFLAYLT